MLVIDDRNKEIKINRRILFPQNIPEKKKSAFWKLANDGWLTDWGIDGWFFRGEEKAELADDTAGTKKSKSASKSEDFDIGTEDSGIDGIAETTGRATGEEVTVGWGWTGWEVSPFIPFSFAAGSLSVRVLGSAYHLQQENKCHKIVVHTHTMSWQLPSFVFVYLFFSYLATKWSLNFCSSFVSDESSAAL